MPDDTDDTDDADSGDSGRVTASDENATNHPRKNENADTGERGADTTTTTATRYPYTNDVLAGVLVAFAVGATAAYIYRGVSVPIWLATVDSLAVTTAVVWAFGAGAFKAAKDAVVGGDSNG